MTSSSAPALAIEARNLSRRYGERVALDRLTLQIAEGIVFGLVGPNGAGKSTTLRILCGLLQPSSGEVTVAGRSPVRERRALQQVIGIMPQTFGLYSYLTVRENLEFYADLYVPSGRSARARIAEVMELTGLNAYAAVRPPELSGGWRQRLALACAILHHPRVLFLDEPTAGVDPVSRRLFWDLIHELNVGGTTIFVTTHYMEEVERCNVVGLLSEGKLRLSGSPNELKQTASRDRELIAIACDECERAFAAMRGATGLCDAYVYGDQLHLSFAVGHDGHAQAASRLADAGIPVMRIVPRPPTMEDVFVAASGSSP
jgi:ABC-2 type transport system ATP-binding protein